VKKGSGKGKGGSFERWVCRELSGWISCEERDDIFWRSAMSGGRATIGLSKGVIRKSQTGDISAVDELGQKFISSFVVECKFYKSMNFQSLLFGKPVNDSIIGFWRQVVRDSESVAKEPLLVAKQNRSFVVLGVDGMGRLYDVLCDDYSMLPLVKSLLAEDHPLCLYNFMEVLDKVDPSFLDWL